MMGAAMHPAEKLEDLSVEAFGDFQPFELLKLGQDRRANPKRAVVGRGFDRDDGQRVVDRQAQPHLVDEIPDPHLAAILVLERVALAVGKPAFDVPESVLAQIALHLDASRMDRLARGGGG
jgi:hypothetical protein